MNITIEKTQRTDGTERFEIHLGGAVYVVSLAKGEKLARDILSLMGIEVALLEDVVEILSDAPGAPIFVDNEVFSLDEIRSWVQRYVAWTMRRIDALAKLEDK